VKIRRTDDGLRLFWCLGCDEPHGLTSGWAFNGDDNAPTFTPSVLVTGFSRHSVERRCHSFVTAGRIQYLSDCYPRARGPDG
jgi:hypothetical protein